MYDLWQKAYSLWSDNKDIIAIGVIVLGLIWKMFGTRIKAGGRIAWGGMKWIFSRKPVPLSPDAADIVMNATRAELIPGTKILRYRQVEYHPYGVVKLEQELYFDGMQGKVVPARLVKLTTAEMKAVRQEYDKRVKAEEARLIALSREEAATPDLPKWRRHAVVGVTGWSGHPGPVGDDGKRRS